MYMVFMESDEFGNEEFKRDTLAEALSTIRRLVRKAADLRDGVERKIGLQVCNEGKDSANGNYARTH